MKKRYFMSGKLQRGRSVHRGKGQPPERRGGRWGTFDASMGGEEGTLSSCLGKVFSRWRGGIVNSSPQGERGGHHCAHSHGRKEGGQSGWLSGVSSGGSEGR